MHLIFFKIKIAPLNIYDKSLKGRMGYFSHVNNLRPALRLYLESLSAEFLDLCPVKDNELIQKIDEINIRLIRKLHLPALRSKKRY